MALLKMMAFCPRLCSPMKAWEPGKAVLKPRPGQAWSLRIGAPPAAASLCAPPGRTGPVEMEIPVARQARQAPSSKPWVPRESTPRQHRWQKCWTTVFLNRFSQPPTA